MKFRLALLTMTVAIAIAGVGNTVSNAHTTEYTTEVQYFEIVAKTHQFGWFGRYTGKLSGKPRCRSGRTVKLFGVFTGERRLVDVAQSSQAGFFAVGGEGEETAPDPEELIFKVPRNSFGSAGHEHSCSPLSSSEEFTPEG